MSILCVCRVYDDRERGYASIRYRSVTIMVYCIDNFYAYTFMSTNTCNMGMILHRMFAIGFVKRENKADFR